VRRTAGSALSTGCFGAWPPGTPRWSRKPLRSVTFLSAGGVCFDIGANYGLYTLTFAAGVGPHGRVFSFEPLPGPHAFLVRALRWLGVDNVTVCRGRSGTIAGRGR
jgi:precorrin-6B methylase 2